MYRGTGTLYSYCTGTGTVVQGYEYTIQVEVKVNCSDTLCRYTILYGRNI